MITKEEVDTVMIDPSSCSIQRHHILVYKERLENLRKENRQVNIVVKTNEMAKTERYDKAIARRNNAASNKKSRRFRAPRYAGRSGCKTLPPRKPRNECNADVIPSTGYNEEWSPHQVCAR